jgi:hypothetical protein
MEDECYEGGHGSYAGHIGICAGIDSSQAFRQTEPMGQNDAFIQCFGWDPQNIGDDATFTVEGRQCEKWGPAVLLWVKPDKGSRKKTWMLAGVCSS